MNLRVVSELCRKIERNLKKGDSVRFCVSPSTPSSGTRGSHSTRVGSLISCRVARSCMQKLLPPPRYNNNTNTFLTMAEPPELSMTTFDNG